MKPVKFNPTNVNEFENVDLESTPFEKQEKYASEDPLLEQLLSHRDINMTMKVQWSNLLKNYLINFTILMFFTLILSRLLFLLNISPLTFLCKISSFF